jgi:hypothetical protein
MGNLIWLVVAGPLFFFMMRRGCGAGPGSGRRSHKRESDDSGSHGEHKHKSGGCL